MKTSSRWTKTLVDNGCASTNNELWFQLEIEQLLRWSPQQKRIFARSEFAYIIWLFHRRRSPQTFPFHVRPSHPPPPPFLININAVTASLPPSNLDHTVLAGNTVLSQSGNNWVITALFPTNNCIFGPIFYYYFWFTADVGCYADSSNRDLWAAEASSGSGSIAGCAAFCSN